MLPDNVKTEDIDRFIAEASEEFGVDEKLIRAVIKVESGGDPGAVSGKGAKGLMQLMDKTAKGLGVTDVHDPEQNIRAGTKYLSQLIKKFGDTKFALAAYNAGPASVVKHQGVPPFKETEKYVKRVMSFYGGGNDGNLSRKSSPLSLQRISPEDFLKETRATTFAPSWGTGSPAATDPGQLPTIPPEFAHGASDEFGELLTRAMRDGVDSLETDDQRRVQAAVEQFPQLGEVFRRRREEGEKKPDPKIADLTKLLQETAMAFGANAHKPYGKQFWESLKVFGSGLNDLIAQGAPGMEHFADRSLSEIVQHGFAKAQLDALPKGSTTFLIEDGELVERPMPDTERVSRNFVRGAIRLAPELLAGFLDNPYVFMTELVKFPIEEVSLIMRAANIQLVNTSRGPIPLRLPRGQGSPYTQEEIEEAQEALKQQPFGVFMLGMMAVGAGRGIARTAKSPAKSKYTTVKTEKAEAFTEDFQKTVEQMVRTREHIDRAQAIERGLGREEQLRVSAEGGRLLREQLRKEEAETKAVVIEAERLAKDVEAMAKAAEDRRITTKEISQRAEVEKGVRRKIEADARAYLKKEGRVEVPEAELGEIVRIKQEGTTALRGELLSMQKEAKTPISVTEIAKMNRNQLEYQISGGFIPREPSLEKIKPSVAKPGIVARKREIEKKVPPEEVRPATEKKPEPIPPEEVAAAKEKVAGLEADLAERRRVVSELDETLEGLKGAEKENVKAFTLSLKVQIAERAAGLIEAKSKLADMVKVPVIKAPKKVERPPARTEVVQRKSEPMEVAERKRDIQAETTGIEIAGEEVVKKIVAEEPNPVKRAQRVKEETDKAITRREKELIEQADKDEVALVEEIKAEPPKPDPETPAGTTNLFGDKKQFEIVPIEELKVDVKRFQGRFEPYSEESVQSIVDAVKRGEFDPNNFDPVHVWRDAKTGEEIVLSGHSRLEAMKRVGSSDIAIVRRNFATEEAAIHWATEQANRMATSEGLRSDVRAFKAMRDRGEDINKLKARFGKNYGDYDAYSYLDPNGKFLDMVGQRAFVDFPSAQKWARAVGELRKQFPELTNAHERQITDQLYPIEKATRLHDKLTKADLEDLLQEQVGDALWNKNMPIKLSKGYEPKVGTRVRPDTKRLMEKLDEAKKRQSMARTTQEVEVWRAEETKIKESISYLIENQAEMFGEGGYELGFFGTPKEYAALLNTAYEGIEGIRNLSRKIGKELTTPPEQLGARMDAREASIKHHQQVILLDYIERRAARQFDKMIKDPVRADVIRNAIQLPKSDWPNQLTSFEKGVVRWLDEERRSVEKFKFDNELVSRAELPPDVEYVMGWWRDAKNRPYKMDWGKFSRSLPQALQKKYKTYLDGEAVGLKPATHNVAKIIFRDKTLAGRAQAGRQYLKTLNQIDAGLDAFIAGEKNARILENWKDIVKADLTEHYTLTSAESVPFLARPIRYKDASGNSHIIRGPVGIHKAVAPWLTEYFKKWDFGTMAKVVGTAKSVKLWGVFHAVQANLSYMVATGRNPVTALIRGRRLRWADDPIVEGLVEHGMKMEGWKDFEFDPVALFKVHRKDIIGKVGNIASEIWTAPIKLTFHEVVNSLKLYDAYRAYESTWPDWQRKIGPDLSREQARSNCLRDAVKHADNMLSHPDFRYGMLESSKFALKFWYSTAGRKFWFYAMLAPNWLRSHIVAFSLGTKAFIPDAILKRMGAKEKRPIDKLYRRYMYGLGTMYGMMQLANYTSTRHMDGEGKFVWENEPGKRLFHVRAPWNSSDGRKEYVLMPKTAIEVPKFTYGLATGETNLIRGKFNPLLTSAVTNFATDVDGMGREIIKDRSYAERGLDFLWGGYSPILISNVHSMMKFHKAPIGSVVSALGFPVSKGYPGGAIGKRIDEYLRKEKIEYREVRDHVVDLLVQGFEGSGVKDADKITEAINTMFQAGWSSQGIYNIFEKFQLPAIHKWNSLSRDQKFSILMAMSPDKQVWFLEELQKEGIIE